MMHSIARKTEAVEARQVDIPEPDESDAIELRLDEVEERVTAVEHRVDKLVTDYEAADEVVAKRGR